MAVSTTLHVIKYCGCEPFTNRIFNFLEVRYMDQVAYPEPLRQLILTIVAYGVEDGQKSHAQAVGDIMTNGSVQHLWYVLR